MKLNLLDYLKDQVGDEVTVEFDEEKGVITGFRGEPSKEQELFMVWLDGKNALVQFVDQFSFAEKDRLVKSLDKFYSVPMEWIESGTSEFRFGSVCFASWGNRESNLEMARKLWPCLRF